MSRWSSCLHTHFLGSVTRWSSYHICTQDLLTAEDGGQEERSPSVDQFKREVAETFLRCIKERISHDNAVIELNGLKIAEDRTFADCARCSRGVSQGAAGCPAMLQTNLCVGRLQVHVHHNAGTVPPREQLYKA